MRRLTLGLALGAIFALGLATTAHAVSTQSTWGVTATGSKAGGSKSAPAPFSGSWLLTSTNLANPAFRPATPQSWSWYWEGVTVNQKKIPVCTTDQVNDARSVAPCPPKSHLGNGPVPGAMFGPAGLAEGPNTFCGGKTMDLYNGKPGEFTLVLDGPPEQCGSLGFLGALPVPLTKAAGHTVMTWPVPENIQHPLPGADGALLGGSQIFNNVKVKNKKKGAKPFNLFTSKNCKGSRDFQMTVVDTFGTQVIKTSAGKCQPPRSRSNAAPLPRLLSRPSGGAAAERRPPLFFTRSAGRR